MNAAEVQVAITPETVNRAALAFCEAPDSPTDACELCRDDALAALRALRADRTAVHSVIAEVAEERERQNAKWGEQNHPNGTGPDGLLLDDVADHRHGIRRFETLRNDAIVQTDIRATDGTVTFADILLEEVFEALAEEDPAKLRTELIQVAAVATQWVEAIDRAADTEAIPDEHDEGICSGGVTMCHECLAAGDPE